MSNVPDNPAGTTVPAQVPIPLEYKFVFAVGYAYAGLIAFSSLWWPFGVDQGIFGWVADVIRSGGTPPLAAWEQKGPVAHYVYALVSMVFGRSEWGIRLFDILFVAGGAVFLGKMIYRSWGKFEALTITLLFVLAYYELGFWNTAQPDAWGSVLCLFALLYSVLPHKERAFELFAVGAAIGVASQCKILFILYLLPALILAATKPGCSASQRIRNAAMVLAGCTGIILAVFFWYYVQGALGEHLEIQFGFNPTIHRTSGTSSLIRQIEQLYEYHYFTLNILAPLALLGALMLFWRNRRLALLLTSIGVIAIFTVIFQGKYWHYHWTMYWFNATIAAGLGFCLLREKFLAWRSEEQTRLAPRIWLVILLVMTMFHTGLRTKLPLYWWAQLVTGHISAQTYKLNFDALTSKIYYADVVHVVDYVKRHSTPEDRVQVWGYCTVINYLADRKSPTRFGFHHPLIAGGASRYKTTYRKEFMAQIEKSPPLFVVVAKKDSSRSLPKASDVCLAEFPAFARFLAARYDMVQISERYDIWRRRDGTKQTLSPAAPL